MTRILTSSGTLILVLALSLAFGCANDELATAEAEEARAREVALSELEEPPTENEAGDGILMVDGVVPAELDPGVQVADCGEVDVLPRIRAQAGGTCATFQAEVSVWAERCVGTCNPGGLDLIAIHAGAAECLDWCSRQGCGQRVTFFPPRNGCVAGDCYRNVRSCPDPNCPLREYCSLIDIQRVWNCFCQDRIIE